MIRSFNFRILAVLAFFVIVSSVPLIAEAAGGSFYGPIVPTECNCPGTAASFGCVLATIQNVINFAVTLGCVAATIALAFAGFTWMMNGSNPEKRAQGRNMLINVLIGLVILLTAWLSIDFLMKKLYNEGSTYGPWNSILQGQAGDQCIKATQGGKINGVGGGLATGIFGGNGNHPPAQPTTTGAKCTGLTASQLVNIDSSGHQLANGTAQNYIAMAQAAAQAGITLRVNYGYRSPQLQYQIWLNHGCHVVDGKNSCSGTVGFPCQVGGTGSNHSTGNAVDISGCTSGGILPWLRANASRYGFYNDLPRDLCHWSTTGG